jgi:hypothetical protein
VASRVHGAASACLVASGLFLCGLGGALAIADPSPSPKIPGDTQLNEVPGTGPKANSDGSAGKVEKGDKDDTDKDETDKDETDTDETDNGGNPNNGNCGNDGSNGNAQHCGGGSSPSSPPSVTPTQSTIASTTKTTSPTTTSRTTSSETTSSETTSSKTTSSETSETTTPTTTSPPGLPAPGGGGGGGGGAVEIPSGRPELPQFQLPPELIPPATEPSAIGAVPGVGAAAVELPIPPITLPVIVAPVIGLGGGGGSPGAPALPVAPRGVAAEPPAGREPLPANVGSNVAVPAASYRIGYTEYLRKAGLSQVAALAVPGVAGMLVLTGAGGLVGYRQAKAGRAVHTGGTARFVN